MRNILDNKFVFSLIILTLVLITSTNINAQNPTPTPTPTDEKKMEKMDMDMKMPTPTPTPKAEKKEMKMDMKMVNPTPTPTPLNKTLPFPIPTPGKDFPKLDGDTKRYGKVMVELLEYEATPNGDNALNWDASGWYGGDYNRFWFRSEGEIEQSSKASGDVEFQGLYGRLVASFYDFQVGLRVDHKWNADERATRFHAVVGIDGIVPYEYEVEPLMFVSNKGDLSFRFTGTKDILLNQRTILEGRFETNVAVQSVEKFGVGSGLNDMEFGIRVRREVRREFAPYIGISYKRLFGQTADFARLDGGRADRFSFVAGVRMWF